MVNPRNPAPIGGSGLTYRDFRLVCSSRAPAQAAERVVERQVRDRADRADRAAGDLDRNVAERDRVQHATRATNQARAVGRDEALARVGPGGSPSAPYRLPGTRTSRP